MNLGRLCVLQKLYLVKLARLLDTYRVKIPVIFGVRFQRRKVDKKQTYMKIETWKLHSKVSAKCHQNLYPYNFQLYRFKVGAFFETQCVVIAVRTYAHTDVKSVTGFFDGNKVVRRLLSIETFSSRLSFYCHFNYTKSVWIWITRHSQQLVMTIVSCLCVEHV